MTTREEFEAWRRTINPHTKFVQHETAYVSMILEDQWQAWQASRTAALEEAAKECDLMQAHYDQIGGKEHADAAEQCAMGIRALKD